MRPIDADEFEEYLSELYDRYTEEIEECKTEGNASGASYLNTHRDLLINIMIRFKQQPTVDRWIPYPKKSPSESGYYYVTAIDCDIRRTTFAKYYKRQKRWELTGRRTYWKVIAWQPLPEPYKGE